MANANLPMREYETIYVLSPSLNDVAAQEFMTKMKDFVIQNNGKSLKVDCWGRRKLAWERNKINRGIYVSHRYVANTDMIKKYERVLLLDENSILHLTSLLKSNVDIEAAVEEEDNLKIEVVREKREMPRDYDRGDSYRPRERSFDDRPRYSDRQAPVEKSEGAKTSGAEDA